MANECSCCIVLRNSLSLSPSLPPSFSFSLSSALLDVCQQALDLNERLIATDQLLYHKELKSKFQQMLSLLTPLLEEEDDREVRGHCRVEFYVGEI